MPCNIPELLSPAGSREAAVAALSAGADALYLGASAFGARQAAGFDEGAMREIIDLAHLHARRVYVTVNILVKERELPALRDTLAFLTDARADAVLVQDMGALALIKAEFPSLCVHASTQMSLHSAQGALFARDLGVSRVVLARECTLEQIRQAAAAGVETEVFVHGAQCVCVSGQCRFSGLIGGRSGNRGRCAQPCRLPYQWNGKAGAWLSPRDLCLRDQLEQLALAGASALKIEGRLKRPEYVYTVTRAYRGALDALAAGRFAPADAAEKRALSQVFSRGFFPGYAFGARDAEVVNPLRASAAGVEIGSVSRVWQKGDTWLCEARLGEALNNGDGLQLRGGREQDVIYAGAPVPKGGSAVLRLHFAAKPGEKLMRIDDERLLSAARAAYESGLAQTLPFDAELFAAPGEKARLTVWDDASRASITGDVAQSAQSAPLDETRARRALEKTGGTPFVLRALHVQGEGAYLPAAALNALRRDALEALAKARIASHRLSEAAKARESDRAAAFPQADKPLLFAQTTNPALMQALLASGADEALYAPGDFTSPALENALDQLPRGAYVTLAPQLTDETLARTLALCAARGLKINAGSVGQLSLCPPGCMLSEGVPVWNSLACAALYRMGGLWQTLPRELTGAEIAQISPSGARFILPVYGRARLMYLNHCPARAARGLGGAGKSACRLCEKGEGCAGRTLNDRTGAAFPLLPARMPEGCLVQLLSDKPRSLAARAPRCYSWLLDFTDESPEQCASITRAYRRLLDGEDAPSLIYAPGRWDKGVE